VPGTRSLGQGLAVDVRFYWPPKAPVLHFADGLILVSLITTEMVVTACRIFPGRDLAISEQFPPAKVWCSGAPHHGEPLLESWAWCGNSLDERAVDTRSRSHLRRANTTARLACPWQQRCR
jgi:hypothetical protein